MPPTTRQRRVMKATLKVTEETLLNIQGGSSSVIIPKFFCKVLGWTRGQTKLSLTVNNDKSLTIRALPPTEPKAPAEAGTPLFQK